jgi:hypothetical protein
MVIIELPFELSDTDVQAGYDAARKTDIYRMVRPQTDEDFVGLLQDFYDEGRERLAYNVGFLFGLYAQT